MGTRENIMTSASARNDFLQACVLLDQEDSGVTATVVARFLQRNLPTLRMQGIRQRLSTYDLFVLWHVIAMSINYPVGNAAHSGPIFLPWHRLYLLRLEEEMQRVLGDPNFGLPYWNWAEDGELNMSAQRNTALWSASHIGEARGQVNSGQIGQMQVRLVMQGRTLLSVNPRPIRRNAGSDVRTLPDKADVDLALNTPNYDSAPWNQSVRSHRNILEGWVNGPTLHNRVHVWVGGDMGPGSSPNDPVFFLNHCNVDRIWEAWMNNTGRQYAPLAGQGPQGHRIDDAMIAILGSSLTPQDVLDPSPWYDYDSLSVS